MHYCELELKAQTYNVGHYKTEAENQTFKSCLDNLVTFFNFQ